MRTKPDFGTRTQKADSENLFQLIVIVLLVYKVIEAILRTISGHGSKLDNFICIAAPICLVILYFWYSRKTKQDERKLLEERQQMTDDQRTVAPNQTVVSISVDGDTYEKLEKRETVPFITNKRSLLLFYLRKNFRREEIASTEERRLAMTYYNVGYNEIGGSHGHGTSIHRITA